MTQRLSCGFSCAGLAKEQPLRADAESQKPDAQTYNERILDRPHLCTRYDSSIWSVRMRATGLDAKCGCKELSHSLWPSLEPLAGVCTWPCYVAWPCAGSRSKRDAFPPAVIRLDAGWLRSHLCVVRQNPRIHV